MFTCGANGKHRPHPERGKANLALADEDPARGGSTLAAGDLKGALEVCPPADEALGVGQDVGEVESYDREGRDEHRLEVGQGEVRRVGRWKAVHQDRERLI